MIKKIISSVLLISVTVISTSFMTLHFSKTLITQQFEALKSELKLEINNTLIAQQDSFKEQALQTRSDYKKTLEDALKISEQQFQVYSSTYVKSLMKKVEDIPNSKSYTEANAKADELFANLMAKTELETYQHGVNHNVIKDVTKTDEAIQYNILRDKLLKLGFSEEDIIEKLKFLK